MIKIIARVRQCRILVAWHFDHALAQQPSPADRAEVPPPTAVPSIVLAITVVVHRRGAGAAVGMRLQR
ncbi:hypothetical protein, partial [Streptomyces sp. PSKA30]|uniref:hypothetical protein n=1 Tax=Streptomyces sp. PSKA30 TaxID=2874597 RepID=UPI0021E27BE8